jgi:surfactin synthase thioesterase subunit
MYRHWPTLLDGLEICPIQLPGRENRLRESPHETYEAMAHDVISAIEAYLDRPFGLFGHCGSALSSYEIAVQLARRGGPLPTCVFVSSQVAPQDGPFGSYLTMDDRALADEVRRLFLELGGAPPRDDLVELSVGVMRADVNANARYRKAQPTSLPCRISAIGWNADRNVPADLMTGWSHCGQTSFHVLNGGHFSFLTAPDELRAVLLAGMDLAGGAASRRPLG